jgi:hypothetical protein
VRIRSFVAFAVLAAALLFGTASVALAKTVPWDSVDLVVHEEQGKQLFIIAGQLPTATPLPAEVEMAVPAGLQLQWAGEILGGDPAKDPSVQYKLAKVGNSDVYSFPVSTSRTAQLELAITDAVRLDGSKYVAAVQWTPSQDVRELKIGFRIPAGAQIGTPVEGAVTVPGPTGFDYYRKTVTNVKAGQPVNFAFDYSMPGVAGAAASGSGASNGNAAAFAIIAVLFATIAGLMFAVWRKMQSKGEGAPATSSARTATKATSSVNRSAAPGSKTSAAARASKATSEPQPKPRSKAGIVLVGVIAALAIGAFFAVNASTKPQVQGDVITRTFSSGDPCTSTVVPLAVTAGGDMSDAAEKLFAVLQTLPSITTATIYKDQPRIEVGYCESSLQPGQVEQALAATGLVATTQ